MSARPPGVPTPGRYVRWDLPNMDDQSTEVDADALVTLLARVAQTTTGVVVTLMGETTGSARSLPIESLSALADEFDWVSSVIRRQVESAQPGGTA